MSLEDRLAAIAADELQDDTLWCFVVLDGEGLPVSTAGPYPDAITASEAAERDRTFMEAIWPSYQSSLGMAFPLEVRHHVMKLSPGLHTLEVLRNANENHHPH